MFARLAGLVFLCWQVNANAAFELETQKVTEKVYALVGEVGPRNVQNHALNNTMGFVITDEAVLLIGSGATPEGARLIEDAITRVTDKPVKWVINIGVQDHHWIGNSYFSDKGSEIIALERTVTGQKSHAQTHLDRLTRVVPDEVDEVRPVYAGRQMKSDHAYLQLDGIPMQLIWTGGGHFVGDAYLWLPEQEVVFSGDLVFHERLLGVQTETRVTALQQAFHDMEVLQPRFVIPGHGHAGDLAQSRRDSGDYVDWLVMNVKRALDDWKDLSETVDDLEDAPEFRHLKYFDTWHRRNINRVYLQLEADQ